MARITWVGHATVLLEFKNGVRIICDPWIKGNPSVSYPFSESVITEIDAVLVTHDHFDHCADVRRIMELSNAIAISTPEVCNKLQAESGLESSRFVAMNLGGTKNIKEVAITMVQAFHTSETGIPCGYIVSAADEATIYFAGDTCIFADMELIGRMYEIDIALLPIGGYYTMDSYQAAMALTLLKPKRVIPIHYRTFPILEQSAEKFSSLSKQFAPEVDVIVLEPGGYFVFPEG